jgi:hypothetical protein
MWRQPRNLIHPVVGNYVPSTVIWDRVCSPITLSFYATWLSSHKWELVFFAYSITYYVAGTASYLWNPSSWCHCLWWFPTLSNLSFAFRISSHTCLSLLPVMSINTQLCSLSVFTACKFLLITNWVRVTATLLLAEDLVDNIIRPDSVDIHVSIDINFYMLFLYRNMLLRCAACLLLSFFLTSVSIW